MSEAEEKPLGKLSIEDGMAVIRIPMEEVHGLRVALEPCPCRAPKSHTTAKIRRRLAKSLGVLQARGRR